MMARADALAGCTEGWDEEAQLNAVVDLIEALRAEALTSSRSADL
jgi:hypothetical protein